MIVVTVLLDRFIEEVLEYERTGARRILDELLEIEKVLWTNSQEDDEILKPKVWEAIQLSRKISGGTPETNKIGRRSAVLSVTSYTLAW